MLKGRLAGQPPGDLRTGRRVGPADASLV